MGDKYKRASSVNCAEVIEVIEVCSEIGTGDCAEVLLEYFSLDGRLLARRSSAERELGTHKRLETTNETPD